jgi:oligopeptide/dipeptide ABC transporter ATP-binding protein
MIAMALSCNPKLLLADEPTTALDVTIQAQILELLTRLTRELGTAVIIITHNLGVVARYADRVNVMYAGKIVEAASAEALYHRPRHAYTLGLLRSVPRLDQARKEKLDPIDGIPPDLVRVPPGCSFRPRCRFAVDRCGEDTPPLLPVEDGRTSACWEWERVAGATKSLGSDQ